jgi:hypothetical protein
LDPVWQTVCFIVAVILFAIAAIVPVPRVNLIALGLAVAFLVFAWNAAAAS